MSLGTVGLNDKGVALNHLKKYHQAIENFQAVLKKDNNNAIATFNLISNYFLIGKWQEAERILEEYGHCLASNDSEMIKQDLLKIKSSSNNIRKTEIAAFEYEDIHSRISRILSKNLFFIMGVPKSGTTWMQHLLTCQCHVHPCSLVVQPPSS